MTAFLKTRIGIGCMVGFVAMMAFVLMRVSGRRKHRPAVESATIGTAAPTAHPAQSQATPSASAPDIARSAPDAAEQKALAENAAYLDRYYELRNRVRDDRDRLGNPLTRRANASAGTQASSVNDEGEAISPKMSRTSARLQGRAAATQSIPPGTEAAGNRSERTSDSSAATPGGAPEVRVGGRSRPSRFNPFGSVIKCELVFTLDSTNEQTPLVAIVMEPVYNNGVVVIPAGAELHGVARPDRLRDRIFSGQDWVLVFPREGMRPNGRQLNVRGVALDRIEPDANGMTWGITDGSYGLSGRVLRTLDAEEIKRFVATFLAGSAAALQDRKSGPHNDDSVRNTPQNAVLQGLAANFEKIASDISAEIAEHGVFIRVPAGHQFYFYPMQLIDPDAAGISSDIAVVR